SQLHAVDMHQAPVKLLVILRAPSPLDLDMCILMRPVQTSEASSHNQTVQAKGSCPFHPKPQWATHLQALIETCNNSFPLLYTQQTSTAKSNELSLASEIGSTSGSSTRQIASQSKSIKSVPPDDRLPYAKTSSTSAPEKKYQPSFLMHTIRQHIKHCLSTSKTVCNNSLKAIMFEITTYVEKEAQNEISSIDTEILNTPIGKLATKSHAFRVLLAVAGLIRVLEWWDAERFFGTFEPEDEDDGDDICFYATQVEHSSVAGSSLVQGAPTPQWK
ncbi:AGC protein kinase, partial [Puccinia sorghi]